MSDLSQLMQIAPGSAAYMMGQNQGNNVALDNLRQQELAQIIQKYQLDNQKSSAMNPLLVDHQRLQNQGLEAGLPGITADSMTKQQAAQKGAATLDTDIAATNSKNQETVDDNNYKHFVRTRDTMIQAAPLLSQTPAPLRAQVFLQHIKDAGMNTDAPGVQKMIKAVQDNPDAAPQFLTQYADMLGKQAILMNPTARVAEEGHRLTAGATVQSAKIHAEATKEAARIASEGRVQAARQRAEAVASLETSIAKGMPPERAAVAAKLKADQSETAEERIFWQRKADEYEALAVRLKGASHEGEPNLTTDANGNVSITPKTVQPALGGKQSKPKGTGTKDDPIVLK